MIEKGTIKIYLKLAGSILGLLAGTFWAGWALVVLLEGGTLDSICVRLLMGFMCFDGVSRA